MEPRDFLSWASEHYPEITLAELQRARVLDDGFNYEMWPGSGMGANEDVPTSWSTASNSWLTALNSIADRVLQIRSQTSLDRLNLERARQGQPPIDAQGNVLPGQQPQPFFSSGGAPGAGGSGLPTWLPLLGLAGLAAWGVSRAAAPRGRRS